MRLSKAIELKLDLASGAPINDLASKCEMGQGQKEEKVHMNRGGGREYVIILSCSELLFGKIYQL